MIVSAWLITVFLLFVYSFTQIDLGLTLTRVSWWQAIQRGFQQIGYFQRPLSTSLYLIILVLLFTSYLCLLKKIKKKELIRQKIWQLILVTAFLLWFSYNAFSYDLFNYIFDARIITHYGQSPYQHKALDFPDDPMLGFMHWTHRLFPYGPFWLVLTVPLSFISFQKLIPIMLLIKGLAVLSYLSSAWLIEKILIKLKPKQALLGLAFFAFNPLVVIESLVSGHNDIVMMAFALAAFWLILKKKYFWSGLMLLLSIGVKFATGLLLPAFLLIVFYRWRKKKINWGKIWLLASGLMLMAVLVAGWRISEIKPWYWLYVFPFFAFWLEKRGLFWLVFGLSIGFLLYYAPFFYLGNWNPPVPMIKINLVLGSLILGGALSLAEKNFKRLSL